MKRSWLLVAVTLALVLALVPVLAGCGEDEPTETTAGATDTTAADTDTTAGGTGTTADPGDVDAAIQAVTKSADIETPPTITAGKLTAGSDTAFPPFEFADEQGNYVGFDIDISTALAKKMGLELEVLPTAWDGIIPALVGERFDMIMSAMTITDERKEQIDFTDPYVEADIAITTPTDAPIENADGLEGKVVGVQVDTTGQFEVEEIEGVKEIKKYDTILSAFQDLYIGRVDAVVNDEPVNAYIIKDRPEYENTGVIETEDVYGYGIKKENTQLVEALNKALAEIKDEGLYDMIFQKWFGELPAQQQ